MAEEKKDRKICFIVTPIGADDSAIRRKIDGIIAEVIEPILKEFGYEMLVSHKINESNSVTRAIIQYVYNSDLVIANLTGNNPNVMYEVALRHASAKPIIHITENIGDLPFDINDHRAIPYTDDMAGAFKLKQELRNMIQTIMSDEMVENPITLALQQNDLVNIPEGTSTNDFSEMLLRLSDDIKQLKREVSSIKERGYRFDEIKYVPDSFDMRAGLFGTVDSDRVQPVRLTISDLESKIKLGQEAVTPYVNGDAKINL